MQLHLDAASVDFSDGYSFIPFVSPDLVIRGANLSDEQTSVLLHEMSHQIAFKGPFGFVCVYLQASRVLGVRLAELQAMTEFIEAGQEPSRAEIKRRAFDVYADAFGSTIASFATLIESYRYWLEGIAVFSQIDFELSQVYETDSDLFTFVFSLLQTDVLRTHPETSVEEQEGVTVNKGGEGVSPRAGKGVSPCICADLLLRHVVQRRPVYVPVQPVLRAPSSRSNRASPRHCWASKSGELIVITWFHEANRDVLQNHPRGDDSRPLTDASLPRTFTPAHRHDRTRSACIPRRCAR